MNAGGKETNLYDLKEGQLCNELSNCFKEEDNLNICARALVDSEICVIPCGIAKRYLKQDIKFLRYMYNDLYRKHQIIIRDKESNRHESLEKRLVKLLMSKSSKSIYATHSELAFEIDSTREVVSRSLKKIEKQGFIYHDDQRRDKDDVRHFSLGIGDEVSGEWCRIYNHNAAHPCRHRSLDRLLWIGADPDRLASSHQGLVEQPSW